MPISETEKTPVPVPPGVLRAAGRWGGTAVTVSALTGDASGRSYFRAMTADGATVVLAAHPEPFDPDNFPFLETTGLFLAAGLPVPVVKATAPEDGILVLEDMGDLLLQEVANAAAGSPPHFPEPEGGRADATRRLYRQAVDLIVRLQQQGTPRVQPESQAGRLALDAERFRFELNYFRDHFIFGLRQASLDGAQRSDLEDALDHLCQRLDGEPRVLCHRDYHARNLLVVDGDSLAVIDHQDARSGPDTYDLASLLHDPYVTLESAFMDELTGRFRASLAGGESGASFAERLDAMAAQRLLKAAGTYAAQKVLHNNDVYLPYLPLALNRAAAALGRHPTHQDLLRILQSLLPEMPWAGGDTRLT